MTKVKKGEPCPHWYGHGAVLLCFEDCYWYRKCERRRT